MSPEPLRYFENAERANHSASNVDVMCSRENSEGPPFRVSLVDLNSTSVKFLTSEPLAFQDSVRLLFSSATCEFAAELQVEVRWHRRKGSEWMVGAIPSLGVPEAMLQSLAVAGAVERRDSHRCTVDVAVEVREVGQTDRKKANIVEFSDGGVRLQLQSASLEEGQPLKLFLDVEGRETAFQLQTRWVGGGTPRLAGFAVADSQANAFRAALAKSMGNKIDGQSSDAVLNRWLRKAKRCVTDRPVLRS
ncbi:MAG: PilZ domain-containing protein [Planctomycetota bacterium]